MVSAVNLWQKLETRRKVFDPLLAVGIVASIGIGLSAMPIWSPAGKLNLYCFSYLSTAIVSWALMYLLASILGENLLRKMGYVKRSFIIQMALAPGLTLLQVGIFALFFTLDWSVWDHARFFAANFFIAMMLRSTELITFRATIHDPAIQRSPFLSRLRQKGRTRLIRIRASDHYLDVYADQGHEMVRMRLADAVKELAAYPGLQVHRSHWVATRMVDKKISRDGKTFLIMDDGYEVPVSTSFVKDLEKRRLG